MKNIIALLSLLLITSCASVPIQQKQAKSLLAIKETIINTHELFRTPCETKIIKKDICQEVDNITEKARIAYDLAADAAIISLQTGDNVNAKDKFNTLIQLEADLMRMSIDYKLVNIPVTKGTK